jgi:Tfp pilus assembly protein PilF
LSLIADSLKKAIKEKSFNVNPGINLLKNLGSQPKPKLDSKEIKRFIILIVIPAAILVYLLLANPFAPEKKLQPVPPPGVAEAPSVKPAPPPAPGPPAQKPVPRDMPAQEPGNTPVIEPGMVEVAITEIDEHEEEQVRPKPVPGPKKEPKKAPVTTVPLKESSKITAPEPADPLTVEKSGSKSPSNKRMTQAEPPKKFTPEDFARAPETSAKASTPQTRPAPLPKTREPDISKDSDHYFNRAIFYQQSGDWDKALSNYSRAAELDPNNPDIYNNIGVIYKELRQYDQAIEEFLKAIDINPDYAKPYNNIGVVYYAKKDFLGAIRNYQKAVLIDPENLEALNNLAVAYNQTDQLERAKTVLNQALAINPAHAGTHYNLAVLYEGEGNIKSAIYFYQRFVELAVASHPTLSAQVKKHIATLK